MSEIDAMRQLHYERSNCRFPKEDCSYSEEGWVHCLCNLEVHCIYCEKKGTCLKCSTINNNG